MLIITLFQLFYASFFKYTFHYAHICPAFYNFRLKSLFFLNFSVFNSLDTIKCEFYN